MVLFRYNDSVGRLLFEERKIVMAQFVLSKYVSRVSGCEKAVPFTFAQERELSKEWTE
jgi:hypothetical protein